MKHLQAKQSSVTRIALVGTILLAGGVAQAASVCAYVPLWVGGGGRVCSPDPNRSVEVTDTRCGDGAGLDGQFKLATSDSVYTIEAQDCSAIMASAVSCVTAIRAGRYNVWSPWRSTGSTGCQ
jgi:hypothetical protein